MPNFSRLAFLSAGFLLFASLITGCGNPPSAVSATHSDPPITLSFAGMKDANTFNQIIGQFVKKKFPEITLEYTQVTGSKDPLLKQLVAEGKTPDIIMSNGINNVADWGSLGINEDLMPYLKKYGFDLNRVDQASIKNIQSISAGGELYALPFYSFHNILYFNKSIFDKFGIAYPTNGMTWPQVYELAKQLTRNVDGIQYRGLDPDGLGRLASELSLRYVDPQTKKALVATDPRWASLMDYLKNVYQIPGNLLDPSLIGSGLKSFSKDKNLAMWVNGILMYSNFPEDLNWDIAALPTWPDAPGQGEAASSALLTLTKTCKYKDQAFKVIAYLLSDEVQLNLSQSGVPTVLQNKQIDQTFGENLPAFKGKNTTAVFFNQSAAYPQVSPYDFQVIATDPVSKALMQIVSGAQDVNTALSQAATQIEQNIVKDSQQK